MRIMLLVLSVVFLGIVAPVFLIAIAAPWPFVNILAGWTLIVSIAYPAWWMAMGKRPLV